MVIAVLIAGHEATTQCKATDVFLEYKFFLGLKMGLPTWIELKELFLSFHISQVSSCPTMFLTPGKYLTLKTPLNFEI